MTTPSPPPPQSINIATPDFNDWGGPRLEDSNPNPITYDFWRIKPIQSQQSQSTPQTYSTLPPAIPAHRARIPTETTESTVSIPPPVVQRPIVPDPWDTFCRVMTFLTIMTIIGITYLVEDYRRTTKRTRRVTR